MSLVFLGIGDPHFDGKMIKYMEDLNHRIVHEMDRVMEWGKREGIGLAVIYGDICETPNMSYQAHTLFLDFLMRWSPYYRILIPLGNHDKEHSTHHSLQIFSRMCDYGLLPKVKIVEESTTFFRKSSTPLRICPWPFLDTDPDALNVIHEAVAGAHWDHGREVEGAKKMKDRCVSGHIHTAQTIGSTNYSGTLYQTSFGEKPRKYFHHVTWEDGEEPVIKRVRHVPSFRLENAIIESQSDVEALSRDRNVLYKAFVKSNAVLDEDAFAELPNVVKFNSFRTRKELEKLIVDEIRLDDEFNVASVLSVENNLKTWLDQSGEEPDLRKRAYRKFKTLFN